MHCRAGACPRRYLPGYPPGGTPARRAPPFLPEEMGRKKGRGGSAHPGPPNTGVHGGGKLYRQSKNRACIHARFLFWFRYRRCRALGGTHRDYPASPGSGCAVPAWPAGPPSVPASEGPGYPRGRAARWPGTFRRLTGSPAPRGSPRAPSRTAPGSSPPQCTAAY